MNDDPGRNAESRHRAVAERGVSAAGTSPWWGPDNIGEGYAAAVKANPSVEPTMVTYHLALLRAGPNRSQREAEAQQIQAAHLAHLNALTQAGKRVAGGPFLHDGVLRGMSVYAVPLDEARQLANADPAVKAGRLVVEFHPWMVADGVFTAKAAPAGSVPPPHVRWKRYSQRTIADPSCSAEGGSSCGKFSGRSLLPWP